MVVNTIPERLAHIGFSKYEAKAYVSLLSKNPVSAYELAKASGIPTSKIYEVLSRLSEKRAVSTLGDEGTKKYIPVEPDEFIAGFNQVDQPLALLPLLAVQFRKLELEIGGEEITIGSAL